MKTEKQKYPTCPKCQGMLCQSWNSDEGPTIRCINCNYRVYEDGDPVQTKAQLHLRLKALEQRLLILEEKLQQ